MTKSLTCDRLTTAASTYALAVVVSSNVDVPTLAKQIQAVYGDDQRAPDGVFQLVKVDTGTAVIFLRDVGADHEIIGDTLTVANTARQLAREFEPSPGDAPIIETLHAALIHRADASDLDAPLTGEGWALFETNRPGFAEIQKDDEANLFADDATAIAYVEAQATLGSHQHLEALAIHKDSVQMAAA